MEVCGSSEEYTDFKRRGYVEYTDLKMIIRGVGSSVQGVQKDPQKSIPTLKRRYYVEYTDLKRNTRGVGSSVYGS